MNADLSQTVSNAPSTAGSVDSPSADFDTIAGGCHPVTLCVIPADVQSEIFHHCAARDITNLACVSVSMRTSLQDHPVIRVFGQIKTPCNYACLVGGMEAIQLVPLQFRALMMREYACRMIRIGDGDGAVPWRYYVLLCHSQINADAHLPNRNESLRDLCLVQSIAMLHMWERATRPLNTVFSWEEEQDVLSPSYRAEVVDSLLEMNCGISAQARDVCTLTDLGQRSAPRGSTRFIAVMAALQLMDDRAHDVCHRFTKRFALTSEQRKTTFDPVVVNTLARCLSRNGGDVGAALNRWGMNFRALVPALHDAFLQKALQAMRGAWTDIFDCAMTKTAPSVHVSVTDHVLGIPTNGIADQHVVLSAMSTFWTLYWPSDSFPSLQSGRIAWQKVTTLDWQVQPTLLDRIVARTKFAGADVADSWGRHGSLASWEQKIFATCIAYDRPRLAIRTLMIACHLSRFKDYDTRSRILRRALALARENTPPWSWNEIIEALCQLRASAIRSQRFDWPSESDIATWMTTFLSDPATCMVAPSPMLVVALFRHAESIWHHLPEGEGGDMGRFDRLCDRLDLMLRDRRGLKASLTRYFPNDAAAVH